MNEDTPNRKDMSDSTETPASRIWRHIKALDDSLYTIDGDTEESRLTRQYLIGQIEALKWAVKLSDGG
jgi:hypothetical protein